MKGCFFLGGGAQNSSLPPGTRYPRYATDRSAKMNTGKEWLHSGPCPGGRGGAGGMGPTLIIEKTKKGLSDFRPPPLRIPGHATDTGEQQSRWQRRRSGGATKESWSQCSQMAALNVKQLLHRQQDPNNILTIQDYPHTETRERLSNSEELSTYIALVPQAATRTNSMK